MYINKNRETKQNKTKIEEEKQNNWKKLINQATIWFARFQIRSKISVVSENKSQITKHFHKEI